MSPVGDAIVEIHDWRGQTGAIRRVDARTWKTRGLKGGENVFAATLLLAQDGGSFREDCETTLVDGTRAVATLVYERYEEE